MTNSAAAAAAAEVDDTERVAEIALNHIHELRVDCEHDPRRCERKELHCYNSGARLTLSYKILTMSVAGGTRV